MCSMFQRPRNRFPSHSHVFIRKFAVRNAVAKGNWTFFLMFLFFDFSCDLSIQQFLNAKVSYFPFSRERRHYRSGLLIYFIQYAELSMNNRTTVENPYCDTCGVALHDRWDYKGQRKDHFPDCPRRYEKSVIEKPAQNDQEETLKRNHQNLVRFLGFMALSLFSVVSKY